MFIDWILCSSVLSVVTKLVCWMFPIPKFQPNKVEFSWSVNEVPSSIYSTKYFCVAQWNAIGLVLQHLIVMVPCGYIIAKNGSLWTHHKPVEKSAWPATACTSLFIQLYILPVAHQYLCFISELHCKVMMEILKHCHLCTEQMPTFYVVRKVHSLLES